MYNYITLAVGYWS